ncbi:hypothetical protein KFK09_007459 [Dendrobium nobile]|uniref:Uncharacterized protein n=1 Tax=Dendrobium nobile TaxID=94219 RepID=A0A8T3BX44_DENNO|nr:hypothetical protein KFK09_007459 [Dendrobium nobile]
MGGGSRDFKSRSKRAGLKFFARAPGSSCHPSCEERSRTAKRGQSNDDKEAEKRRCNLCTPCESTKTKNDDEKEKMKGESQVGFLGWMSSSISSAFFASLERFSCINLSTSDLNEDIDEEAKDLPLVHSAQNSSDYRSDEPSFATNFTSEWAPTSD